MRKMMLTLAALMTAGAAQAAVFVSYVPGAGALIPGMTVIEDFESYADGATLVGGTNAKAFAAPVTDVAAKPGFNSTGNFGAALGPLAGPPIVGNGDWTINFGANSGTIFSFALGSLDAYNTLTLYFSGGGSQTFSGASIATGATADGNQALPTSNGRVYYVSDGDLITGARFQSSDFSFEFDDLATGSVPEPSTWAMMVLGFGIVGRAMRRRRQMAIASFA